MADTLNIRVASDLTDSQYDILKEEKQAGRRAYFYQGRLHYHTGKEAYPARSGYRQQKERREERHHYENKQRDRQHNEDRQQDTLHQEDLQGSLHHEERHQERFPLEDRQKDWYQQECSRTEHHLEDTEHNVQLAKERQKISRLSDDQLHYRNKQPRETRKQLLGQKNRDDQSYCNGKRQRGSVVNEANSNSEGSMAKHSH